MRKMFCLIAMLLIGGIFFFFGKQNSYNNIQPYIYPIKPGTNEWAELETLEEMIEVSSVPQKILDKMDTASLVETCMNHPLMINPIAFNNHQLWFEEMLIQNNALNELLTREDARNCLNEYKRNHSGLYSQYAEILLNRNEFK